MSDDSRNAYLGSAMPPRRPRPIYDIPERLTAHVATGIPCYPAFTYDYGPAQLCKLNLSCQTVTYDRPGCQTFPYDPGPQTPPERPPPDDLGTLYDALETSQREFLEPPCLRCFSR
jgi:hypothetical protein